MDIEELVEKHMGNYYGLNSYAEADIRAALTELAAEYEQKLSSAKLEIERLQLIIERCGESDLIACRKINEANERIRQLEAERVPEGWKMVPTEATSDMVKAGMMVGDVGLYAIYGVMIDAAPEKKGE